MSEVPKYLSMRQSKLKRIAKSLKRISVFSIPPNNTVS